MKQSHPTQVSEFNSSSIMFAQTTYLPGRTRSKLNQNGLEDNLYDNSLPFSHMPHPLFRHPVQAKLLLGDSNDQYEQEADRMAKLAVRNIRSDSTSKGERATHRMQTQDISEYTQYSPQRKVHIPDESESPESLSSDIPAIATRGGPNFHIPNDIRFPLEHSLNADLRGVQIHTSSHAHQLNIELQSRAFTQGQHIYFRRGEYNPQTVEGQQLLAHETTHVLQQVPKLSVSDSSKVTPYHSPTPIVQRALYVGTYEFLNPEQAYAALFSHVSPNLAFPTDPQTALLAGQTINYTPIHELLQMHKDETTQILKQWIDISQNRFVRMVKGQTFHHGVFYDYDQLALAVLGQINAQENLQKETELAKQAIGSDNIDQKLNSLIPKIYQQFTDTSNSTINQHFSPKYRGRYWPWYSLAVGSNFSDVFQHPEAYKIPAKIAALHDLTDYIFNLGRQGTQHKQYLNIVYVPSQKSVASSHIPGKKIDLERHHVDQTVGNRLHRTINQHHESMIAARLFAKPVEVGASYTTGRFMQLASCSGATLTELEALAWGLFAFWNQSYTTSASGIHRLHFVMDMASNYGVPYDLTQPLPTHLPGFDDAPFSSASSPDQVMSTPTQSASRQEVSTNRQEGDNDTQIQAPPPLNLNPRTWASAKTVEAMTQMGGLYRITGEKGDIVIKLFPDDKTGLEMAFGSHFGQILGVNTVVPEYFSVENSQLTEGLQKLAFLSPDGPRLITEISSVQSVLVTPFISGHHFSQEPARLGRSFAEPQKESLGRKLGRIFMLNLVLFNQRPQGDNIRMDHDVNVYAMPQSMGEMAQGEMANFSIEKTVSILNNLTAERQRFIFDLLPRDHNDIAINRGFNQGLWQVIEQLAKTTDKELDSIYSALIGRPITGIAPGIAMQLKFFAHQCPNCLKHSLGID